jgi:hypothetical protein
MKIITCCYFCGKELKNCHHLNKKGDLVIEVSEECECKFESEATNAIIKKFNDYLR